jgi:hypothetical protein
MSGNHPFVLAALLAAGCWNPPMAVAAGNPCAGSVDARETEAESRGPIHFESSKVTVDIKKGKGGTLLAAGFNDLARQTLECHAIDGCLFTVTAMVMARDPGSSYLCTYVDGSPVGPQPAPLVGYLNFLGSRRIATGTHSIQTKVFVESSTTILPWEVDYTLYDN